MRTVWAVLLGVLCASLALGTLRRVSALSNPFSRPYRVPYAGETIRDVPVRIEEDGTYDVLLEVPHRKGESVPWPKTPPLLASVALHGRSIEKPAHGGAWGGEKDEVDVVSFRAHRGDLVHLSISPDPSGSSGLLARRPHLAVARVPIGYAEFFVARFALQFLAALLASASLVAFGVGWIARPTRYQGGPVPSEASKP